MIRAAIVVALLAFAAACGSSEDAPAVERKSEKLEAQRRAAEAERARAEEIARQQERQTAELKTQVDAVIAALADLDDQMKEAEKQLAAATSQAERAAASTRVEEIRRHQLVAQERLDKIKAGIKLKCPPENPLC